MSIKFKKELPPAPKKSKPATANLRRAAKKKVTMNLRVSPEFRKEVKMYAMLMESTIIEVMTEGFNLLKSSRKP